MKKILLTMSIVLVLTLALLVPATVSAEEEKPLVVVVAHGLFGEDLQLNYMMSNITEVEWKVITEEITFDEIKDADMLIYVQVDTGVEITDVELNAIKQWFDQGGKTLWVTGDSDYTGGDYMRIPNANKILEAVGSVLRNDHTEAVDREVNFGEDYRLGALIKPDPELFFLAGGVLHPVLFHGPAPIALYVNGEWKPLYGTGEKPVENVYRIAITSPKGAIAEFVEPLPHAYEVGEEGSFTLMAAEFMDKDNIVILSTEAPFDHYQGMWVSEYKGIKGSGPEFIRNIILWGVGLYGSRIPEVIKLKKEMASLSEEINSLKSELEKLKSDKESLEAELENTKKTLSSQIDSLKSQLSTCQEEKSALQSDKETLMKEVESLRGALNTYMLGGAVIGLIIGFAIGFFLKKKPS
mgnify:CR=1 FL=1